MTGNATQRVLDALALSSGRSVTENGSGWITGCPAHDDRRPSLSVSEGDDGRVLIHCHAGCSTNEVLDATGLTASDLYPEDSVSSQHNASKPLNSGSCADAPSRKRTGRAFPSQQDAVAAFEGKLGSADARWDYTDVERRVIGTVLRWDTSDGKTIRQLSKVDEGWVHKAMPEPRPLLGLPFSDDASAIFVVEGEKCVDELVGLGLTATTWAGGSNAVQKSDWTALSGRDVIIIPDNDRPGWQAAEDIARTLQSLSPPATVRVLSMPTLWPECPEKGDVANWSEHHDAQPVNTLVEILTAAVARTEPYRPEPSLPAIEPYEAFPVDALPEPMRGLVVAGSKSVGCDPAFIALPLLSVFASAIGNTRRLHVKSGWNVPPILWTVIVGTSGSGKSPCWNIAMDPVEELEAAEARDFSKAMAAHTERETEWKARYMEWKKGKGDEPEPQKPERPKLVRHSISDVTIEAVAALLHQNPRGLLVSHDELAAFFGGFDKYRSGKSDAASWLSMFNASSIRVDRKTGDLPNIFVPAAAVCVTGGIQPKTLRRAISNEHRDNGLLPRFLFAFPPEQPRRWTEAGIHRSAIDAVNEAITRLYGLQFDLDRNGEHRPGLIKLTPDAKSLFIQFFNQHGIEREELRDELRAAWSKLEESALRLALVIHLTRWAAGESVEQRELDESSMRAGIVLTRWFCHETKRVYGMLDASPEEQERTELIEFIRRRGGEIAARDAVAGIRRLKSASDAEALLNGLVKEGIGMWDDVPPGSQGGRPTRRFRLIC